ncbi:MAG: hypothetical protein HP031_08135 [Oscillospiraceae bacterium]|nr:hypothetical protein [Oscillospiraceae bacterium]
MKISCMQGRIESLLPPNVDPGSTLSSLNGAFIGGLTGSMLWFVTKYSRDYQALFTYDSVLRKKTLVAGARIAPFTDYEGCALWLLVYFAIIAAVWVVLLYGSFSRGSRSLYLMRRLPEGRKPLFAYVLRAPVRYMVYGAMLCAVLLGVYYIIWRFITPESCLPF